MGKKGLSLDEKRQKILEIYYEKVSFIGVRLMHEKQKEVFILKEIEKYGAKKGVGKDNSNEMICIVLQTIKDVN